MRVFVTPRAEAVVERVLAAGRDGLVMVLGTGCCDSTAPFLYDHYYPGSDVVEVGTVAGVPVHAHEWLARLYADEGGLIIDVDNDLANDSFSLESEYDCRFTLRAAGTSRGASTRSGPQAR
jgi:uncharacterized protein (DUF779 family)